MLKQPSVLRGIGILYLDYGVFDLPLLLSLMIVGCWKK
jgi:hypothetical protein